jgi:hypothetical protein
MQKGLDLIHWSGDCFIGFEDDHPKYGKAPYHFI